MDLIGKNPCTHATLHLVTLCVWKQYGALFAADFSGQLSTTHFAFVEYF